MTSQPPPAKPPPPPDARYDPAWHVIRAFEETEARRCLDHRRPVLLWGPSGQGCSWLCGRIADTWRPPAPPGSPDSPDSEPPGPTTALPVTALVDCRHLLRSDLASLESCLLAMAEHMERSVDAPADTVAERWATMHDAPNRRFARLLERLLERTPGGFLLVFDHADRIHEHPYYEDFATLLRSLAERPSAPWDRLRLIVAVSVPPERLRFKEHASPFANLADPIQVGDLSSDQLTDLAHGRGLDPWTRTESERLRAVIGGHPHLACIALDDLREGRYGLEDLEADRVPGDSPPGDDALRGSLLAAHLERLRKRLSSEPLRRAFAAVARGQVGQGGMPEVSEADLDELMSRGLVARASDGTYTLRYPMYQRLPGARGAASVPDSDGAGGTDGADAAGTDPSGEGPVDQPDASLSWPKIALGAALGAMLLAVLLLLLPSMKARLIVGGVIGLGVVIFLAVIARSPEYFYRRQLGLVIAAGLTIHATGFTVKAGGVFQWNSETGGLFTVAWVALIGMLIWAEHRERER